MNDNRKSAVSWFQEVKKPLIAVLCILLLVTGVRFVSKDGSSSSGGTAFALEPDTSNLRKTDPMQYAEITKAVRELDLRLLRTLVKEDGKNEVLSPVNIYLATAMLAEISGGTTKEAIMDFLGTKDLEELEKGIADLWNGLNNTEGSETLTLHTANSIWIDESAKLNKIPLQRLADHQYASSFAGQMGSEALNRKLRSWIDERTGGLLKEITKNLELDPDTVMALVSVLYMKDNWDKKFLKEQNTEETFYTSAGAIRCTMMHCSEYGRVYVGSNFTAYQKQMSGTSMLFVKPDEGVSLEEVIAGAEFEHLLSHPNDFDNKEGTVRLSVPKFDVMNQTDLEKTLTELGLGEMFTADADFSPLSEEALRISKAIHGCRIKVDETGVEGAAFTIYEMAKTALGPDNIIEFTLDRPFVYVVKTHGGVHLFSGTVENPGK
ncbi:MAG: hypothetical protein IIU06_04525 [Erysipelotrichales bacterium]|nr:hypothetical protein [Erysipelotrichales bacterium]